MTTPAEAIDLAGNEAVTAWEALALAAVRKEFPELSLRTGSVIRDALVRPFGVVGAAFGVLSDEAALQYDLAALSALAEPTDAQVAAAARLLANRGITLRPGASATGFVSASATSDRAYLIPAGTGFADASGATYTTDRLYRVVATSGTASTALDELQLRRRTSGGYVVRIPVTAGAVGAAGTLKEGSQLTALSTLADMSAFTATGFTGGADQESIASGISRAELAASTASVDSPSGALARLTTWVGTQVTAANAVGGASPVIQRGKRNLLGFADGACADIYFKTGDEPALLEVEITGARGTDGSFAIRLTETEAPGLLNVTNVRDASTLEGATFTQSKVARFSTDNPFSLTSTLDSAGSEYQVTELTVTGLPGQDTERKLLVAYRAFPGLAQVQAALDDNAPAGTSLLARAANPVYLQMQVCVKAAPGATVDAVKIASNVRSIVNSRAFVREFTLAEIFPACFVEGVSHVVLSGRDRTRFSATYLDCDGVQRTASGPTVSFASLPAAQGVTHETSVLCLLADDVTVVVA